MQLFPYCTWIEDDVVLCHLNSEAKGMGNKSPDWWAVYACSACHDIIDGRKQQTQIQPIELEICKQRALFRTWERMIGEGLIKV